MRRALIGFTGFVGSNLARLHPGGYTDLYNSANFRAMAGQHYDAQATALAGGRTLAFFQRNLG